MKNTTIAIDLAKSVFEIGISDRPGHIARSHRLSRTELAAFVAAQPPATVVMEACSSAHYWGRKFEGLRPRCEIAAAFRGAPLRSTFENRPDRRQRHARSLAQQRHPPRSNQN